MGYGTILLVSESLPGKILVVRLGAIGDVVNALVFAAAVKEASPEVETGWVVHPLARPLVEGHPCVDRVHVWYKRGGVGAIVGVIREIRRVGYDLAVDLQRITKSALLARLSGAPRVLGYDRRRAKEVSWLWTKERIRAGAPHDHMVEQYLDFARHLGIDDPAARHRFAADPEAEAWAVALVEELGGQPILVGIGATKPANRWNGERFGSLAVACRRTLEAPVCLTGSADDRATEAEAARVVGTEPGVVSLVGKTSLRQLVALAGRARLFIGCDTGPMHVAAACGTPVVALFGPADPRRTGPWGAGHAVVRVPPPCAPQPRHACMEDITVELVLDTARTVSERSLSRPHGGEA